MMCREITPSWRALLTWLTPGRDKKARYLSVRFRHPPRLEPDLRLSPHPAQHPEILLGLCSVTIGADNLYIAYTVCILGIFEPGAGYDVITIHLAGMEWDSLALAIGAIDCTNGPFERDGFIP